MSQQILKADIQKLITKGKVLDDADSLQHYGRDWTKAYQPAPALVVLPKTIEEAQALVHYASTHKIALVPSGGRTGLSGGAVAANGEIVVAFDLMNKILDFNASDGTVTVQPGVVTRTLQEFATEQGFFYPVDFASSGSSQNGGNIATNAGGIKVIRYGLTRDWILGLKVITGEGKLLELNKGLIKNATGYDFRHLFIGSEGTLGLIVEATIKLAKPPEHLQVMVLACADFASIMQTLAVFQKQMDLCAFEFFSEIALQKVTAHGDVRKPFETAAPFYVLLEYDVLTEQTAEKAFHVFEQCVEQGLVLDGVLSQNKKQAEELWALRERISETLSAFTPYKNDISVKVSLVPDLVQEIDALVQAAYPEFEIVWYGHIGDGNMHLNILKPESWSKDDFFAECKRVSQFVFEVIEKYQGSISAEHGLGLLKKDFLHYTRSEDEIRYMKAMKMVFDPNNIMNPGKVLPDSETS
jgi:glycolate oxidase subunit GlcD